jgi:hypothetical protein
MRDGNLSLHAPGSAVSLADRRTIQARSVTGFRRIRSDRLLLCAVACLGALAFAARAVWAGQDANWDLQNYHRYAGYALLHWRYPLDVGAAGFQGYLNPLPYLLPFWLDSVLPPPCAAMVLAIAQSVVVPLAWLVAGALQRRRDILVQACATAAGVTSAMTLSETGTSFADLPIAALVLGAVWALLRAEAARDRAARDRGRWQGLAGALIGAATGLKLTNGLFMPGLLIACLATSGPWRQKASAAAIAMAGAGVGAMLTDGAWAFYLWHAFDSPVFPALNTLFHAPSAALINFDDPRFLPSGWLDGLAYPFRIALGQHPTAETPFSDPRFAALTLVTAVIPFVHFRGRPLSRPLAMAGLFTAGAYVTWLVLFSIQRYAVALEILAGMLAVQIIADWLPARVGRVAVCAGVALLVAFTRPPDWWHRPWTETYVPKPPSELMTPAAFVVVSHPTGYWAAALADESRFYSLAPTGLATGGILRDRVVAGLATPPVGGLWTLGADMPMGPAVRSQLAALGLVPGKPCVRAPSLWGMDTIFCRLTHAGTRAQAAADLAVGDKVDFTNTGSGWIYELPGWANAGPAGTPTLGRAARLVFRPAAAAGPLVFTLSAAAAGTPSGGGFALDIDGQPSVPALSDAGVTGNSRVVCIWNDAPGVGIVEVAVRTEDRESGSHSLNLVVQSISLRTAHTDECRRPD